MKLSDYEYHLPKELIAQSFAEPRDSSKLMVIESGYIKHKKFREIIDFFKPGDVLVLNDTKVMSNKIEGKKASGAKCIFLVESTEGGVSKCRIKGSHPRIGNEYSFPNELTCKIEGIENDTYFVRFNTDINEYLDKFGDMPIPFYVKSKIKNQGRYQTEFFKQGKSLAAPTAGLHFTNDLLKAIEKKGILIAKVRLDISFSTFLKVTDENIKKNKLHEEYIEIDELNADIINSRMGRLIVCGTTSLRTLESCADEQGIIIPQRKVTDIFIHPGYKWKTNPEIIITNFHLPKSSLLMMISAYIGIEKLFEAYDMAIREKYRFFSLGDAMMIIK
jgi:S-adenosylmethionine:tRNA ribosyltransferase-isomerase